MVLYLKGLKLERDLIYLGDNHQISTFWPYLKVFRHFYLPDALLVRLREKNVELNQIGLGWVGGGMCGAELFNFGCNQCDQLLMGPKPENV